MAASKGKMSRDNMALQNPSKYVLYSMQQDERG